MRVLAFGGAFIAPIALASLLFTSAAAEVSPDKAAFVSRARAAYYNLPREGVTGFQCSVSPDWNLVLAAQLAQNPEGAKTAIAILSQLQYVVTLAPDGSMSLEHNTLTGQSPQSMQAIDEVNAGMKQMLSGFFDTWKAYVMGGLLPPNGEDFQMEPTEGGNRLQWKEGETSVEELVGPDFSAGYLKIVAPAFSSEIRARFYSTPKGLLLSGYTANYRTAKPEEATDLSVDLAYQDVDGVRLPQQLDVDATSGGVRNKVQVTFSGCRATR